MSVPWRWVIVALLVSPTVFAVVAMSLERLSERAAALCTTSPISSAALCCWSTAAEIALVATSTSRNDDAIFAEGPVIQPRS